MFSLIAYDELGWLLVQVFPLDHRLVRVPVICLLLQLLTFDRHSLICKERASLSSSTMRAHHEL